MKDSLAPCNTGCFFDRIWYLDACLVGLEISEKTCVILLLCFGRILIIGQGGYRKTLARFDTDCYGSGSSGKAVLLCCTNIYIRFC